MADEPREVMWCEQCRVTVEAGTAAYIKHSMSEHHGGGWRGVKVRQDEVPGT